MLYNSSIHLDCELIDLGEGVVAERESVHVGSGRGSERDVHEGAADPNPDAIEVPQPHDAMR